MIRLYPKVERRNKDLLARVEAIGTGGVDRRDDIAVAIERKVAGRMRALDRAPIRLRNRLERFHRRAAPDTKARRRIAIGAKIIAGALLFDHRDPGMASQFANRRLN